MKCNNCENEAKKHRRLCKSCIIKRQDELFKVRKQEVGSKAWLNQKRKSLKRSAVERNLEYSLSIEEANALFLNIPTDCPYCENPMIRPSVDRVDNTSGYHSGNCLMVCLDCNMTKSRLTTSQILNIAKYIEKGNS